MFTALYLVQGCYYLLTGIWPLLSIGTFQAVTGPKTDRWLVKTVGALVTVVGAVLLLNARSKQREPQAAALACGSAVAFTAIDTIYVARRRISPIYLLDALLEIALLGAFGFARRRGSSHKAKS